MDNGTENEVYTYRISLRWNPRVLVTAPPTCLCVPTGLASCARVSLLEAAARLSFGGFEAMDLSLGVCVAVMSCLAPIESHVWHHSRASWLRIHTP